MVSAVKGDSMFGASVAAGSAIAFLIVFLVMIALIIFYAAAVWRILEKAGVPGWGAIIPIYNIYLWCKVVGRPGWWVVLLFIPVVSVIVTLILSLDLAKAFAKSSGFGVGLWLLSMIFVPILGYGPSTYIGPNPTALV
jgi:uncharacterized membrane protein YhaH (DUF805 family)